MRTAADNYVEIRVRARDTAKPDLTSLKADLDELGRKVETAKVSVDDADGKARLLSLNAKLAALNAKVANPKISVSGAARAEAEIALVDAALDHLGDKEEKTSSGRAGISLGSGFLHGFVSFVVPGLKTALVTGISSVMAMLPALGAIGGAGLVIGMGAMIAAKIPGVAKQFQAFGTQAMGVLKSAVQPMIGPMLAGLRQLGEFLKNIAPLLRQMFAAAAPMIEGFVNGLEGVVGGILPGLISLLRAAQPAIAAFSNLLSGLGSDLGSMFSSFAPAVAASSRVLAAVGTILNGLLPVVAKLAGVFAQALAPVITTFGNALVAVTPALTLVGEILGKLAGAVLRSLSGALAGVAGIVKSVAPAFGTLAGILGRVFQVMENTGVFGILEDALEGLAGPVGKLVNALVSGLAPILPPVIGLVSQLSGTAIKLLITAVQILVPVAIQLINDVLRPLLPAVQALIPVIEVVATILGAGLGAVLRVIAPLLARLAPYILMVVAAVKAWTIAQGILDVVMDANPIGLIIVAIIALIGVIVEVVKHWHDIAAVAKAVFHDVLAAIADVFDWVKSHWPLILVALTGPIGIAVAIILALFPRLLSGVEHAVSGVVGWFRRLPGMILSAIASLGSDLFNAGAHIISMLASGISSAIGDVTGAIGHIASEITSHLPFSPAKKGPLSGSGSPDRSGAKIAQMLAQGMTSGRSAVTEAAARMAGAAGVGGRPAVAGAGTGGMIPLQLSLQVNGADSLLLKWIRNQVRIHGGGGPDSVQKAFGRMS